MTKWEWGYVYWGAIWLGLGFLVAEILGELRVAPWLTLSETSWHAEQTYNPWLPVALFGLLIFLGLHILFRKPVALALIAGMLIALATHLVDKRLP